MSFKCEAFPVILQSAGSGFLTNQENAHVQGVIKSYVIRYLQPFLRSSSCKQLLYSRLVETFSGKFSLSISDRIRKNMPAVDSKTVPVARSVLTTPLARRKPPTQAHDRDLSSRGPCQHRTFKQAQTIQQTQSITKLFKHSN